ncbi:MAG TPA: peptidoglycan DD-metalloendopeptidase family protein [Acidimicrobiales bacterium]|nr:peptidoglycan DD-metalloendopeptidase family protein [Acidimicrobiales bacterium]
MRAPLVLAMTVALLISAAPAGAQSSELDSARRQANQVASELASAQSRLAELRGEVAALEATYGATAARVVLLRSLVSEAAILEFMRGGDMLKVSVLDPDLAVSARGAVLARFAGADTTDVVDELRAAAADLEREAAALTRARADAADAVESVRERAARANVELARQERIDAERRARVEAERRRKEQEAAAQRARERAASVAAPDGTASRRTSTPAPRSAPAPSRGSWTCPVQGPRAFTNDWGQPRSGGRRHQGTDILSPRGTPVVASVSGSVRGHNSRLGGISYYLKGDDGTTYFGTHLDSLSGASGRVSQGTVLGYVGDSGNARGGPTHLHFEIHPGGGSPVNPYPTLAANC